jgi:ribosomal protein S18 acetylase RimI-like enzyme
VDTQSEWWVASAPVGDDVADLSALWRRHEVHVRGGSSADEEAVAADVVGWGAASRRHLVARSPDGTVRGWASVHDRAAGRVLASLVVDPDLPDSEADPLAEALLDWSRSQAVTIAAERGLPVTQLDSGAFVDDERQQRWLAAAGLSQVRTWWQMSRPVLAEEGEPGAFPGARDGVLIRPVGPGPDGMPDLDDLRAVHDVLETAFADHFNSYEETFDEFCARLRADPGHRWDHWWLAELVDGDGSVPAGALVGEVLPGQGGPDGSYVAYMGVLESARGRGIAKSLLHTVIADAARRGRDRVGLEVDADSPTGAHGLYRSMGFVTKYETQSWHLDVPVPKPVAP